MTDLRLKTSRTYCLVWWLLALPGLAQLARAQVNMQVVSKTVERELTDVNQFIIKANKAGVVVKSWTKSGIGLRIRFVAKHPDRAVAERDIGYGSYEVRQGGGGAELANRYDIPKAVGRVQSTLSTTIEVMVPQRCGLKITASFGDVLLSDLAGEVLVNYEYGKLTLVNLTGKTTAISAYGDLQANNTAGQLLLKTEKTNVVLQNLGGSATLQCRYGKLLIRPAAPLVALTVTASRTEVTLIPRRLDEFRYDLRNTYADIHVPAPLREYLGEYMNRQVFDYDVPTRKPLIKIDNSYSPINLQTLGSAEMAGGN